MTRRVRLAFPIVVVLGAAVGLSMYAAARRPRVDDGMAPPAPSGHPSSPPTGEPAPAGKRAVGGPRAGAQAAPGGSARSAPRVGVDEAIKELDLIRPSREKLAEDFTVNTSDGRTFRLRDHRGKIVFLNFWATWCAPCKEEMPSMERLYREHKDRGLVVVAVSVDADPAVVRPFLTEHRLSFAAGVDPKMEVASRYGVRALPSSFLVDREGRMMAFALGPRTWDTAAAHSLVEGLIH
jgi:peroxiredoxin